MRTQETDVEVFGGEVESLTTAGIEGVGVRVIVDHRQGYASAGSLDPDVDRRDAARSARQRRVRRARRVERARVARRRRTVSAPADLDLWRDELLALPDRGEGADRARPRGRRPRRATRACAASRRRATATRAPSRRSSTRSVSRRTSRRTTCSAHAVALADDGSGTQTGYGFAAGRSLADLDLESIPRRRRRPCRAPPRRGADRRAGASR